MADFKHAQREALRILREYGPESPPVDPVRIARELGVDVVFANFGENAATVAGFYDFEDNAIYVNSAEYPQRQTFTIAHELGHKILHENWARSENYTAMLRDSMAYRDDREREADAFAAHLLVPRSMLDRYRRLASKEELADLFCVSLAVIKNRLQFEYGS